ncbi:hypothetical protein I4U23_016754 [Adineta vaga]|nr:hypothetical protein I4U23_016754 [Adineta vaga]
MASAAETLANNDNKKLSANQLAALKNARGTDDESQLKEDYDLLWMNYPKGYMTEEEFVAKFHESQTFGKDTNFSPAKQLFSVIDQNKSGMVDLFEYQLGFILISKQDVNLIINYLFKIFDSDKDGQLSQAEVVDVLNTFFSLIVRKNDDGTTEKPDYNLEEIKNDVSNAFGDKTQISQNGLFEVLEKSDIIQDFGGRLQTTNLMSMMIGDCCLQ